MFVAIVCHVTVMWCQSVMIKDPQDMYHVPMTCMVLEICGNIHESDFSTLIMCGTETMPIPHALRVAILYNKYLTSSAYKMAIYHTVLLARKSSICLAQALHYGLCHLLATTTRTIEALAG